MRITKYFSVLPVFLLLSSLAHATYYDKETGLLQNGFRDYDPSQGRYVESDPIGRLGGLSTYGYVKGNPLSFTDRFGLDIDYANHLVAGPFYHSKLIITPNDQARYANDPRFQNFDANGKRFATL